MSAGKVMGRAEGLAVGRAEGRTEEKTEIAKKLKAKGFDVNDIAEATGLTAEEIGGLA